MSNVVLLTDHPWPDVEIERAILERAGCRLISGPVEASPASQIERMVDEHDPVAIMTCWAQVSAAAIERPTRLMMVGRMGVGLDNIAVAAATTRGAWVTNVPDYCVEEVSDHALALLLDRWRGISLLDREVKAGQWNPAGANLRRVAEMTVGIIGYGRIGVATARKLSQGFGCQVLVNSPSLLQRHDAGHDLQPGIRVADHAMLQAQADALILHAPLTSQTLHLIDATYLRRLERKPLLINVSRGALVDTAALLAALDAGQLAGAGLDVIEGEPAPPAAVTARADIIVTPHVAFSSDASLTELRRRCAEEVVRVLNGERPRHPCNEPAGVLR